MLLDSGEVWMLHDYERDAGRRYRLVDSSVSGLRRVPRIREGFVHSGKREADDDHDDYVEDVIEQARQGDPAMSEDEDSWRSRVFEEVELGVLGPEEA
ncbi:hypothetical protein [Embleya sp. NPDC059259]|uniref:hypothetical protein n=1 Tax=unclassified Embleya TaxID=2699296 RepID=UPI003679B8E8